MLNSRLIAATETFKKKKGYSDATIRKMQTGTQKKEEEEEEEETKKIVFFCFFFCYQQRRRRPWQQQ